MSKSKLKGFYMLLPLPALKTVLLSPLDKYITDFHLQQQDTQFT